ncbi:MAG: hypothetical protein KC931_26900 [Candidatus Omnitrophica bacterium]|nr:hypothetical protein [Candidatus Omnitrophota bacterium]
MNAIPKPRSEDERVFVSAYRYDTIRGFLIRVLIPMIGLVPLVAIPYFSWGFYQSMVEEVPSDAHRQLLAFLATLNLMGLFIAFSFFFLAAYLKRKVFDTYIICNNQEVIWRTGPKEIRKPWSEVQELKIRNLGRIQTATLVYTKGKITFDATMIDNSGPKPSIRLTLSGEQFRFPNLNTQEVKILENDLYGVVKKKFDKVKK